MSAQVTEFPMAPARRTIPAKRAHQEGATIYVLPSVQIERCGDGEPHPTLADQAHVVRELIPMLREQARQGSLGRSMRTEELDLFFHILEAAAGTLRRLSIGAVP